MAPSWTKESDGGRFCFFSSLVRSVSTSASLIKLIIVDFGIGVPSFMPAGFVSVGFCSRFLRSYSTSSSLISYLVPLSKTYWYWPRSFLSSSFMDGGAGVSSSSSLAGFSSSFVSAWDSLDSLGSSDLDLTFFWSSSSCFLILSNSFSSFYFSLFMVGSRVAVAASCFLSSTLSDSGSSSLVSALVSVVLAVSVVVYSLPALFSLVVSSMAFLVIFLRARSADSLTSKS